MKPNSAADGTLAITPQQAYEAALSSHGFQADPAQAEAVAELSRLFHELMDWRPPSPGLVARLLGRESQAGDTRAGAWPLPLGRRRSR